MEPIPRDLAEWCQFDRYCKLVLQHEAIDYLREQKYRRDNETTFSALQQTELDQLCTTDRYPSESYMFTAHGCDLMIDLMINNEQVAEAFASLSVQEQSILILRCVLDMTDKQIGTVMGLSRSTVQYRRTKTLAALKTKLTEMIPEGGEK